MGRKIFIEADLRLSVPAHQCTLWSPSANYLTSKPLFLRQSHEITTIILIPYKVVRRQVRENLCEVLVNIIIDRFGNFCWETCY